MRVTIEDVVYSLVIEVKIESKFDNGKGRMIQTTDIFLVCVGMRGNLVRARRRASKSGSRGGGSSEWRVEREWTPQLINAFDCFYSFSSGTQNKALLNVGIVARISQCYYYVHFFGKFKKFVFLTHFLDPRQFRLGPSPKVAFFFGIPLFTEFLL